MQRLCKIRFERSRNPNLPSFFYHSPDRPPARPDHVCAIGGSRRRRDPHGCRTAGSTLPGCSTCRLQAGFPSERAEVFGDVYGNPQDGFVAYMKGAPKTVIDMCGYVSTALGESPLSPDLRTQLIETNDRLAASGLRVLALASGHTATADRSGLRNLVFAGFVGLIDPPAAGVKSTIVRLRAAGLRIVMLTGDQRRTAQAIGRELGILSTGDEACDSREWRALSVEERHARVDTVGAFSRISAEDKLRSSPHSRREAR